MFCFIEILTFTEQKFKQKCKELKKRILEVEGNNEIATLALSRTKAAIRRARLEYAILIERLEDRAILIPDGINAFEEMASPPVPSVLDESISSSGSKLARNGLMKKATKRTKTTTTTSGNPVVKSLKTRDPDLPKKPTNAYLRFCEMEKERIKQELEEKTPGVAVDLSKTMTEAWKNLSEDDRKPYYKLYEEDRLRYQKEMLVYTQKKQGTEDPEELPNKKQKLDSNIDEETPEIKDDEDMEEGDGFHDVSTIDGVAISNDKVLELLIPQLKSNIQKDDETGDEEAFHPDMDNSISEQ